MKKGSILISGCVVDIIISFYNISVLSTMPLAARLEQRSGMLHIKPKWEEICILGLGIKFKTKKAVVRLGKQLTKIIELSEKNHLEHSAL